jgi:hypothetical protein
VSIDREAGRARPEAGLVQRLLHHRLRLDAALREDRDALKRRRNGLQADAVQQLLEQYLPHV